MVEINIDEILKVGALTKKVNIGNFEVELKTLTNKDMTEILEALSTKEESMQNVHLFRNEVLKRSIVSINGKQLTQEEKQHLLDNLQYSVIVFLYNKYEELDKEQAQLIEEFKKK